MKRVILLIAALGASLAFAGSRVGGPYDMEYESLNSGGISFATNGAIKLGGTLGQNGFVFVRTNGAALSQDGFWKAFSACEMIPLAFTSISPATNSVRLVFPTVPSNTYTVAYLNLEGGGLTNGLPAWTNIVAGPFVAQGTLGSTTTLFVNVSAVTNRGQFFVIRCR